MRAYLEIMQRILAEGDERSDRTGVGTFAIFGPQIEFDLRDGFPLVTTKRIPFRHVAVELFWFLRGDTNVAYLHEHGVTIWDEWADENGDLGPIYGFQWRRWGERQVPVYLGPDGNGAPTIVPRGGIDQIARVVKSIRARPHSRRHLVSAWNVNDLHKMNLEPCHVLFQFFVSRQGLSLKMYQRSADWFLGVPFNIAQYALLLSMVAQVCELEPQRLILTFGDAHIYKNHVTQARTQLGRDPLPLPKLVLNPKTTLLDDFKIQEVGVENYTYHPHIPAPVAV